MHIKNSMVNNYFEGFFSISGVTQFNYRCFLNFDAAFPVLL